MDIDYYPYRFLLSKHLRLPYAFCRLSFFTASLLHSYTIITCSSSAVICFFCVISVLFLLDLYLCKSVLSVCIRVLPGRGRAVFRVPFSVLRHALFTFSYTNCLK